MRVLAILFAVFLTAVAAGFFLLTSAFYEPDELSPDSLIAWVVIPAAVRDLDVGKTCAPVRISKRYIECGGICGEHYQLTFGSTEGTDAITDRLRPLIAANLPRHQVDTIALSAVDPECPQLMVTVTHDERD